MTATRPDFASFKRIDTRLECPLCRHRMSTMFGTGGAKRHAGKLHRLCACGRWFASIETHLGKVESSVAAMALAGDLQHGEVA